MIRLLLPACALLCLGLAHAADERFPYACSDGTRFEAAFPTDSEGVTTAIIFNGNRRFVLPQVPSASGALYRKDGISLHTKGDDAVFDDGHGQPRQCTRADLLPPPAAAEPATPGSFLDITGSVTYRARIALPPDAVLVVKVQDTSRAGAPALVLAEQRIELGGQQVPIPFNMLVDRDLIGKKARITVAARIQSGSKLLFISDTVYPALADGQPRQVDMVLKQVTTSRKGR